MRYGESLKVSLPDVLYQNVLFIKSQVTNMVEVSFIYFWSLISQNLYY